MQIAPLIHSRTLYCDFNINFAVRPSDLKVNWAMQKVVQSTMDIDILNGARLLTASQGGIGIAGIACKLRYFIEKYVPEILDEAQKYFRDERGREIKVFLGYVFKGEGVPNVRPKDLWQMFKENLVPQWEFKVSETVIVDYQNCETRTNGGRVFPVEAIRGVEFYMQGADENVIFEQCISEHKNFCSNVDQYKIISSGEFNAIATTQSNIDRFKNELTQKKTQSTVQTQAATAQKTPYRVNRPTPPQSGSGGNSTGLIIGGAAVAILALIGYLMS